MPPQKHFSFIPDVDEHALTVDHC